MHNGIFPSFCLVRLLTFCVAVFAFARAVSIGFNKGRLSERFGRVSRLRRSYPCVFSYAPTCFFYSSRHSEVLYICGGPYMRMRERFRTACKGSSNIICKGFSNIICKGFHISYAKARARAFIGVFTRLVYYKNHFLSTNVKKARLTLEILLRLCYNLLKYFLTGEKQ